MSNDVANAFGGLFGLLILVLDIIAVVEVAESSRPLLQKVAWMLFIFLCPALGVLIYYIFGRHQTGYNAIA